VVGFEEAFMRGLLSALLILSAATLVFGQDTNFANGPQYLRTGSSYFAQPIATPTMHLQDPPLEVGADTATGVLLAGAENRTVLPPQAAALPQIDLFPIYYGRSPSRIEISFAESASGQSHFELPASILEGSVSQAGVESVANEIGHKISLGELASRRKLDARHSSRVYTNIDIDLMHHRNAKYSEAAGN
jgi:hypothetical protein